MSKLSSQEAKAAYLAKYLAPAPETKKKKKKPAPSTGSGLKIIDSDIDLRKLSSGKEVSILVVFFLKFKNH